MNKRNIYFDNTKFILIFLVVLGHFTNLNLNTPIMGGLNNIIYSFHMPLFIFITGFFSRRINTQRKVEVDKILYTYLIFEILHLLFTKTTHLGHGSYNLFRPTYQNWYLLGIFIWRLLVPYFSFFPKGLALTISVLISILIGLFADFNTFLGLYRIIYFMPFFILGTYLENIESLKIRFLKYRNVVVALLLISFLSIFMLSELKAQFNSAISYAYTPYSHSTNVIPIIIRFLGFFTSTFISFLVLLIIPSKKTFFSHFGERTMNVFLLHMFLVYPINWLLGRFIMHDWELVIYSILSSVLITYFLSLNFWVRLMGPLTSLEKALSLTRCKKA
jgi:fucose 4-O-acetylase-like acetyltransferase